MRLAESYAAACATIGQQVRVDLPSGESLTGTASGIDPSGRLLVEHAVRAAPVTPRSAPATSYTSAASSRRARPDR